MFIEVRGVFEYMELRITYNCMYLHTTLIIICLQLDVYIMTQDIRSEILLIQERTIF